jgi:hypothetical protein
MVTHRVCWLQNDVTSRLKTVCWKLDDLQHSYLRNYEKCEDQSVVCESCSCEISSSHGGEYDVQSCLLGYTAV